MNLLKGNIFIRGQINWWSNACILLVADFMQIGGRWPAVSVEFIAKCKGEKIAVKIK